MSYNSNLFPNEESVDKPDIIDLKPSNKNEELSDLVFERINLLKSRIPSIVSSTLNYDKSNSRHNLTDFISNDVFYASRSYLINTPFASEFILPKDYNSDIDFITEFDLELIYESIIDNTNHVNNIREHSDYFKRMNVRDINSLISTLSVNLNFNSDYNVLVNNNKYDSNSITDISNLLNRIDIAVDLIANIIDSRKSAALEYKSLIDRELSSF